MKNALIFLYSRFYPVKSGSAVHGYNLAREFHAMGYTIFIPHNQADGFTVSMAGMKLIRALAQARVVYLRASVRRPYSINSIPMLLWLLRKKVFLEINAPFEEQRFEGVSETLIQRYKKYLSFVLRCVTGVIVVSDSMKQYVQLELNYDRVIVIANGGERLIESRQTISDAHSAFNCKYSRQVLWMPNQYFAQSMELEKHLCAHLIAHGLGVVLVDASDEGMVLDDLPTEHMLILRRPAREVLAGAMAGAMAGIAIYDLAKYSRLGLPFYGSPLKVYEYLANGLAVITNLDPAWLPETHGTLINVENFDDVLTALEQPAKSDAANARLWRDVAQETENFIAECCDRSEHR